MRELRGTIARRHARGSAPSADADRAQPPERRRAFVVAGMHRSRSGEFVASHSLSVISSCAWVSTEPGHRCTPFPNVECAAAGRSKSTVSGSGNSRSSRPCSGGNTIMSPAFRVTPLMTWSVFSRRALVMMGKRRSISTTAGRIVSASSIKRCRWPGWRDRKAMISAIVEMTVSRPPVSMAVAISTASSSLISGPPGCTVTNSLSRSLPGRHLRSATYGRSSAA